MLLADKRDLKNKLKLSVLHIEEKELNLYTDNCNTLGTQAALLSGFAFAAIIETPASEFSFEAQRTNSKSMWYSVTIVTMLLELAALVKAMQLSLWAPNLALRGPEGSMTVSLIVMRAEYRKVHALFYAGLVGFHTSAALYAWSFFFDQLAIPMTVIIFCVLCWLIFDTRVLHRKLRLPETYKDGVHWGETSRDSDAEEEQGSTFRRRLPTPLKRADTATDLIFRTTVTERLRAFKLNRFPKLRGRRLRRVTKGSTTRYKDFCDLSAGLHAATISGKSEQSAVDPAAGALPAGHVSHAAEALEVAKAVAPSSDCATDPDVVNHHQESMRAAEAHNEEQAPSAKLVRQSSWPWMDGLIEAVARCVTPAEGLPKPRWQ
ncbi:hypothetical protein AB1Y20_015267 [Prymnesium parvum]|uniref:Transmembrane protein 107 n=1 Tax=Prymnesium parvum TaxID=97485 RepID=A0AB34JW92_PRYPA